MEFEPTNRPDIKTIYNKLLQIDPESSTENGQYVELQLTTFRTTDIEYGTIENCDKSIEQFKSASSCKSFSESIIKDLDLNEKKQEK